MSIAENTATEASRRLDDLYRRHADDIYRYAYAVLGNRSDAEDVTQATFVNALRALNRGEQPRAPARWLTVIAHNLVRQRWRHDARRPAEVQLVDVVALEADPMQPELDDLVRALQRIPPTQREALVMRELEGRSYAEIGELLGLTQSALETVLFRARRSLADEIENLVTCGRAELDLTRRLDGRLTRKEARRLEAHLAECTSCSRRAESYVRQRRALGGLAVLPVPLGATFIPTSAVGIGGGLTVIGGGASTAAAVGSGAAVATIGAAGAGTLGAGATAGTAGAGLFGGAALKVAAAVVVGTIATGAGVKGITTHEQRESGTRATPVGAVSGTPSRDAGGGAASSATRSVARQRSENRQRGRANPSGRSAGRAVRRGDHEAPSAKQGNRSTRRSVKAPARGPSTHISPKNRASSSGGPAVKAERRAPRGESKPSTRAGATESSKSPPKAPTSQSAKGSKAAKSDKARARPTGGSSGAPASGATDTGSRRNDS